jgi:protein-tyrosine phosphatase
MIDIHNHAIYGVDDGAKDLEESLEIIKLCMLEGIREIICTSHYRPSFFTYSKEKQETHFHHLQSTIKELGLDIKLYEGNECYLDEYLLEALESKECLTLNHGSYALIEIISVTDFNLVKRMLFDLMKAGYKPVLAHVERLVRVKTDLVRLESLSDMGCMLQVNSKGLLFEKKSWLKKWIIKGLKKGYIDLIATDSHNTGYRKPMLKELIEYLEKKVGSDVIRKVLEENPRKILNG